MARPLKIFMRGKNVAALQELLSRMGFPIHDQARLFGASTRDAVKSFQRQQGLSPNGQVDTELLQMLQQGLPAKSRTKKHKPDSALPASLQPENQQQLDALIQLLIQKNIISSAELEQQMAAHPQQLEISPQPLV